jgi:hypothetical protein
LLLELLDLSTLLIKLLLLRFQLPLRLLVLDFLILHLVTNHRTTSSA